jgi:WD40 repeat protein
MGNLGYTDRASRGLVFAWRRWHLSLVVLGLIIVIAATEWDISTGAGSKDRPSAQIAQDDFDTPIWSLALGGNDRVASSTIAGEVRVKDLATGRVLQLHDDRESYPLSLAFTPGGRTLAIAGNGPAVRIWDAETRIEQEPLRPETGAIKTVAFSPDGTRLGVGMWKSEGQNPVVKLWEWPARRHLATLEGHQGNINGLAFSPDGSRLAIADAAGQVKLWDVRTGKERARRQAHEAGVMFVAFSPDDRLFATTCYVDRDVRLWDAASGEPRGSLKVPAGVPALAFSPDGTMIEMARGDGIASLSDIASGRGLGTVRVPTGSLQAIAFSDDGRMLATGGGDGSVRLWDVAKILGGDR